MAKYARKFSRIAGFTDEKRIVIAGKVRLGIKGRKGDKEYPIEIPFFSLPPEVARLHGFKSADEAVAKAKALGVTRTDVLKVIAEEHGRMTDRLPVAFPSDDDSEVFPHSLVWYHPGEPGPRCMGDKVVAERSVKHMTEGGARRMPKQDIIPHDPRRTALVQCPCALFEDDDGPCKFRGHLLFYIEGIPGTVCYQLSTGGVASIRNIVGGLSMVRDFVGFICLFVPFVLTRQAYVTRHKGQASTHWAVLLGGNFDREEIPAIRGKRDLALSVSSRLVLPAAPDVTSPEFDYEHAIICEEPETPPAPDGRPDMREDAPQEPESEPNEEMALCASLAASIRTASSSSELQAAWAAVTEAQGSLTDEEKRALTLLKNKRKRELHGDDREAGT